MRKNPAAYGLPGNKLSEGAVEKVLKDQLILSNVRELAKYGMVRKLCVLRQQAGFTAVLTSSPECALLE